LKASKTNLQKIENLFTDLGYTVRYEKGNFTAGQAIVMKNRVVVINKFFDTLGRQNALLDIFATIDDIDLTLFSQASLKFLKKYSLLEDNSIIQIK
jgi:hypothetical protein